VVNRQDENVGKIHELAVDAEDGRQVCVVSSIGSLMSMGSKRFAMAWGAFEFHTTENRLMLESRFVLEPAQTLFRNRMRHFRILCHPSEGA
jgi:hypothetical protein